MGSRRLCVQYRLQAAWRFDLGDPSEASNLNYNPVKGVAPISNLLLLTSLTALRLQRQSYFRTRPFPQLLCNKPARLCQRC